jgi:hypothetical protein
MVVMPDTTKEFESIADKCKDIFLKKMKDYGTAWRILRTTSLTDQIFIKAQRIRTLEENGFSKVDEGVEPEFIGIINYCAMALIQLEKGIADADYGYDTEIADLYIQKIEEAKQLMLDKNHDYGEAWRDMRVSSLTDLILMKLLRVKQIEDNDGKTIISEGLDANYLDIINYSVFALIKLEFHK